MPNLVGIGNTQVPTNAMLGGLAYQDSVGEIDIDKIKARTSDTAVDIFVYDTRKDSDGGAWRHRTQNKSWYNEGVSQYRGARKEFPAVAIIVAKATEVTIYDGDDPNLPMWMVFVAGEIASMGAALQFWGTSTAGVVSSVTMLNGELIISVNNGSDSGVYVGIAGVNFISDSGFFRRTYSNQHVNLINPISERNETQSSYPVLAGGLVGGNANDVAMTVLPNAPIDASTGLPVPTIAVATAGGVSVIKDNGIVVDLISSHSGYANCAFTGIADNQVLLSYEASNTPRRFWVHDIPSSDTTVTSSVILRGSANEFYKDYNSGFSGNALNFHGYHSIPTPNYKYASKALLTSNYLYLGLDKNLAIINRNKNSAGGEDGMLCGIGNNYNTGWLVGDNKGAFLSSTDDTNLSGTSLIANGDFSSSSTAAFTQVAGGTAAVVGGLLKLTDTGGVFCYASAPFTTVPGDQYFITADIVNSSNTANANYIRCGNAHNGTEFHDNNYGTSYGTKTFYFTATATTTYLTLISGNGVGEIGHWDNVFAYKMDNDRSVNNKGLQPYGTITKSAVATGAELVAYGGYSYNNYLDIDSTFAPGTSDFSVITWIKPGTNGSGTGSYLHLFNMGTNSSPGQARSTGFTFKMVTSGSGGYSPYFYNADGGTNQGTYDINNRIPLGVWSQLIGMRRGGKAYIYLNGRLLQTGSTWSTNLTDTYASIFRVPGYTNEVGGDAKVALLRYSLSAPTDAQIEKMYNDEKCLFHENAKCTLYGTSDAITGLSHDDTTDVLHVGTSAGRSDFRKLNRINNTTTAVTTAISASNELVAEQ